MDSTTSAVITAPIDAIGIPQESDLNQYPQLSATEIKKLLIFSGMSDAGKFEALIANIDTAGLLALFGMSYADLKDILALPNDKPTSAPGISQAFPSTENTGVTSVHDASPTVSGTGTPTEPPAAGSSSLAPPVLAEGHDAGLSPKAIDSGADSDAVNTPSPATSGMVPDSNPAPLAPAPEPNAAQGMLPDDACTAEYQPVVAEPVPVPENTYVPGMLPDYFCTVAYQPISAEPAPLLVPENIDDQGLLPNDPCNADLAEITQVPADPVDLSPESGSNIRLSVAAMKNVLDFFGMSDATSSGTLEAFTHHADFFEWFDSRFITKYAARNLAAPRVNADSVDEQIGIETNNAIQIQTSIVDDVQDRGAKPRDVSEQNQSNDHTLPETSSVLLGGPTAPNPNPDPVPEGVPVFHVQPQIPVAPEPQIPVAPEPQPMPPAGQFPGLNGDAGAQGTDPSSDSEGGPVDHGSSGNEEDGQMSDDDADNLEGGDQGEMQDENPTEAPATQPPSTAGADPTATWSDGGFKAGGVGAKNESSSSSSSSSSSHGGGGGGGSFSFSGGGLDHSSTIVAGGAGSVILHSVVNGQTGVNFGGGAGQNSDHPVDQEMPPSTGDTGPAPVQPPTQVPDPSAAWLAARDAYVTAKAAAENYHRELESLVDERDQTMFDIQVARERKAAIEAEMSRETGNIGNNVSKIAEINTKIIENEFQIDQLNAQREANRIARIMAQQRALDAGNAITNALEAIRATAEEDAQERARQADIIIAQGKIISERDATLSEGEASDNAGISAIAKLRAHIEQGKKIIAAIQEVNQGIENKLIEGQRYIEKVQKYIVMNSDRVAELADPIRETAALRAHWIDALIQAGNSLDALSAYQGTNTRPPDHCWESSEIDLTPGLDDWDQPQGLPPIPPGYSVTDTGATHTTTTSGTSFVPHNAHSGSHPAAGPMSFNVMPDTPENHELSLQVEMVHPSILAGSSAAVLRADTVMHDLPIVHTIIDAWMRTLPSSAQITFQGFDILNADQAGPVTLAIRFAPSTGHTAEASMDLPQDAVAVLKAAIQGAVASWEQDQQSAATIVYDTTRSLSAGAPEHPRVNPSRIDDHSDDPSVHALTSPAPLPSTPHAPADVVAVPLHYGTADMMTLDSVTLTFEFAPPSGTSEFTDFIHHSHDIPALQGVLAHWLGSIDPGFAATVVAFEMFDFDLAGDGGITLQVLVSDMPVIPDAATLLALQNAMQDYLAAPASPAPEHPANLDGTMHQALSVVGVVEHSGQV